MRKITFLFCVVFSSISTFSQNSGHGFLGQKFKFEANYAPSFYASPILSTILPINSDFYQADTYFAGELRLEAFLSRKASLGFTYKTSSFNFRRTYISTIGEFTEVSSKISSYQLSFSSYPGIVPLNRYYLLGIGVDRMNINPDNEDWPNNRPTAVSIPFISFELGSNAFLSNHVYLSYGIESTLAFPRRVFSDFVNFEDLNYTLFSVSRLLEFKFGIGVSL